MHICLTANTDWYLWNFRRELAEAIRAEGHRVSLLCPPGEYVARLADAGFEVRTFPAPTDGFSLRGNGEALGRIAREYRALQPDLVHLFTPMCVLLGSLAAGRTGVPHVVAALTGLGHVFTAHSLKARAARPGLRWLFRRQLSRDGTAVVFQNAPDRDELIAAGVVRPERCHLIRGSGVDIAQFRPAERARDDDEIRVLFASRLLREKGIDELVVAMDEVRLKHPGAVLWVAGTVYPPNPTSLSVDDVAQLAARRGVKVLGHVDDMPGLLSQVDIVALPSWREGTPRILLEAAASGLPIVATDIPGCQGVVEDGESGYLVPVRDAGALADRIGQLCADGEERRRMGLVGRRIIEDGFSSAIVIRRTLDVYRGLVTAA